MSKEMNPLRSLHYSRRYYLTHPWKFFRDCWINLKNSWMRISRGWCWADLWNFDGWFLYIIPDMLRELSQRANGYPCGGEFSDLDSWQEWLAQMAINLENCREDIYEKKNEYYDEYMKSLDNWNLNEERAEEDKKLCKKYIAREQELFNEAQKLLQDTLSEISRFFFCIWD